MAAKRCQFCEHFVVAWDLGCHFLPRNTLTTWISTCLGLGIHHLTFIDLLVHQELCSLRIIGPYYWTLVWLCFLQGSGISKATGFEIPWFLGYPVLQDYDNLFKGSREGPIRIQSNVFAKGFEGYPIGGISTQQIVKTPESKLTFRATILLGDMYANIFVLLTLIL